MIQNDTQFSARNTTFLSYQNAIQWTLITQHGYEKDISIDRFRACANKRKNGGMAVEGGHHFKFTPSIRRPGTSPAFCSTLTATSTDRQRPMYTSPPAHTATRWKSVMSSRY